MCFMKGIEIKYYFIRDKVQEEEVKIEYIPTDEQRTNILTKPLSRKVCIFPREDGDRGNKSLS